MERLTGRDEKGNIFANIDLSCPKGISDWIEKAAHVLINHEERNCIIPEGDYVYEVMDDLKIIKSVIIESHNDIYYGNSKSGGVVMFMPQQIGKYFFRSRKEAEFEIKLRKEMIK